MKMLSSKELPTYCSSDFILSLFFQPSVEGIKAFPGLQMHCHNYRHSNIFRGKRVVVVGASFSGRSFF